VGEPVIPRVALGSTGLELSRIGFGGAPIGDIGKAPCNADAEALLEAAWQAGIRYFDTAPFYGAGLSERRIGDFLRTRPRDSYVLSTKVGRLLVPDRDFALERYGTPAAMPFRPVFDFTHDGILRSFEASLQRLGLERIDILLLHDIGRFSQKERHEERWAELTKGGGLKALESLRQSGAVRAIGAGVNEGEVLLDLMGEARFDVFLLANRYTLLDQKVIGELLPRCLAEGIGIIAGAPLNTGILLTGAVPGASFDYAPASEAMLEKTGRIEAVCARHEVPLIRAALQFPLAHPAVTSLIPGFARVSDLDQNLVHLSSTIAPAFWEELRAEGLIDARVPVPDGPALG
jgi:D-threo-aldose 1-dehydrogenase